MSSISPADAAEIAYKHIDLVLAKLDQMRVLVGESSLLTKAFESADKDLITFLRDFGQKESKKQVKIQSSHQKFIDDNAERLRTIGEITNYVVSWFIQGKKCLLQMSECCDELDLRWNFLLTHRFCHIFIVLEKVALYFSTYRTARLGFYASAFLRPEVKLTRDRDLIHQFLNTCMSSPFDLMKDDLISARLGRLLSQAGPCLVQAIGQWPMIDWQELVVFNRHVQQNDSTLPDLMHLCLANLPMLCEMALLFVMSYPKFVSAHAQLKTLMKEIVSETQTFYITRSGGLDFDVLLAAYNKGTRGQIELNQAHIQYQRKMKYAMSHPQRVTHLYVILNDIVSLCEFDIAYLPKLTNDIVAICGFAFYELNILFQDAVPYDRAMQLLDLLVRLAKMYLKFGEIIERFFVFNLGAVDRTFLAQLCTQFGNGRLDWQQKLLSLFEELLSNLSLVDLDEFDRGVRYDFMPFMVTLNRICMFFNEVSQTNRTAYLKPILEHLETIRTHMLWATSPVHAFLRYCPIHRLWSQTEAFSAYIKNSVGGCHLMSALFELFAIFNLDKISLSMLKSEVSRLSGVLQTLRGDMLTHFYQMINLYLSADSPMTAIVNQNRFLELFDPTPFMNSPTGLDSKFLENDIKWKTTVWQMKELMFRLPESIDFGGKKLQIAPFIGQNVTGNLAQIMFKEISTDPLWIDQSFAAATQLLWPLYSLLNAPFSRRMYECRYDNAAYDGQAPYLELINKLTAEWSGSDKLKIGQSKIITAFENCLKEFLAGPCIDTLYSSWSRRFMSIGAENVRCWSVDSLRHLVNNIGLHATYNLDHILIMSIANSMKTVFDIYTGLGNECSAWLQESRKSGDKWMEAFSRPELEKASKEMVKLGVALVIREMLRESTADVVNRTFPGLVELVVSAYHRSYDDMNVMETLIIELITTIPFNRFISKALSTKGITKTTDTIQFLFFMALILGSDYWSDSVYSAQAAVITHNLHLYPVALAAFIDLFDEFAISAQCSVIGDGMQFFFNVLQHVIHHWSDDRVTEPATVNTFVVLVDLIPRSITKIEYGRTSASFPTTVITEAYRLLEKEKHMVSPVSGKKRSKKQKKPKRKEQK